MDEESKPFDKQAWIDALANLIASARVPPSTVYMDGSHNPKPSEIQKARMFVEDLLEDLTNYAVEESKDALNQAKEFARIRCEDDCDWDYIYDLLEKIKLC